MPPRSGMHAATPDSTGTSVPLAPRPPNPLGACRGPSSAYL